MDNKKIIIIISTIFIVIAGIFYCTSYQDNTKLVFTQQDEIELTKQPFIEKDSLSSQKEVNIDIPVQEEKIFVHICGSVINSGVYKMKKDTRVFDLIKKAGGFAKDAARDYVNQAQILVDGQKIYIPSNEELKEEAYQEIPNNQDEIKKEESIININQASLEELMNLPGIGEAKAKSILKYREENGKFNSTEELKNIQGIKDGVFNKISSQIKIEG